MEKTILYGRNSRIWKKQSFMEIMDFEISGNRFGAVFCFTLVRILFYSPYRKGVKSKRRVGGEWEMSGRKLSQRIQLRA
jgi:hypothetical protein